MGVFGFRVIVGAALAVALLCAGVGAVPSAAVEAPGIAGTVTAVGGAPLGGLEVDVYAAGEPSHTDGTDVVAQATTSNTGAYTLSGLAPGVYKVHFRGPTGNEGPWNQAAGSWVAQWYAGASSYGSARTVTVGTSGVVRGVNATLTRGGVISGHATNVGGAPAYGLYVFVVSKDNPDEFVPGATAGSVDSNGNFHIHNLPGGTFYLKASCGCRNGLPKPWFGFTDSTATAMPTVVPAGAHVRGQNYSLGGPVASISAPPVSVVAAGGHAKAKVSWQRPVSTGGAPISAYTVTSSPGGKRCTSAGLSCDVAGLTNGVRYSFTVTATNTAGTSIASTPSNVVAPTAPPSKPSAVRNVKVVCPRAGVAAVTWVRPASLGSPGPVVYKVRISAANTLVYRPEFTTTAPTATFTRLVRGSTYRVQIVAVNTTGRSPVTTIIVRPTR